jgi:hypothetical protein
VTFIPTGDPADPHEDGPEDPWAVLREALAADVRRVSDRLRSLSATRLASPPGPSPDGGPLFASRAKAGRAAAAELARAATALEAASGRPDLGHPAQSRQVPDLPVLSDLAVGDQVAVTGHDLLAALDLVGPAVPVSTSADENRTRTAEQIVRAAAQSLTDVRRRL